MGTSFNVSNVASLNAAIRQMDTTTVATSYTISLDSSLTLSADLDAINLANGSSLTILGNGYTLDGNGLYRGLFVYDGNVTIGNLTLSDMKAVGGAGGSGSTGGAGGGAGLGGGLFVASGGDVTLNGVSFSADSATGGAGGAGSGTGGVAGGGGMGGAGGNANGFSSIGSGGGGLGGAGGSGSATGSAGFVPGAGSNSGGGGGGGSASLGGSGGGIGGTVPTTQSGGTGGFGGGGGGGSGNSGVGGNGGFGGGGGGSWSRGGGGGGFGGGGGGGWTKGGGGGFGGGNAGGGSGNGHRGGGGGLGAGGDIFVQQGGTLAIEGGSLAVGTVQGGAGGTGSNGNGTSGSAFGSGLFIQGTQDVTLDPTAGNSLTISGVIADQSGSGGTGSNAGAGSLVVNGDGSVTLDAANTYTGGTTLDAGTLDLASAGAGGSGAISFSTTNANVLDIGTFETGGTFANTLDNFAGSATLDLLGMNFAPGHTSATVINTNTLQVTNGTDTIDFTLTGSIAPSYNVADPPNSTLVSANTLPQCFLEGTRIATPEGEGAVETLRAGDFVRLAEGGRARVRWVGRSTVAARFADPQRSFPVRLCAGALGDNVPCRDLLLSPGHAVRIGDILAHASALVNGTTIVREARMPERFTYWHVELDTHSLILAEGAAAETFLDDWQEQAFDDVSDRPAPLPTLTELPLPRCRAARQVPSAVRALLAAREAVMIRPQAA
jgi:hypothetical protein